MGKIRKILIIKGASQYGVLRYVCDELMRAFCEYACITSMLDLTHISSYDDIDFRHLEQNDMIFSFDVIGIDIYKMMNHKPLFWTFLVDPPFYLHERLLQIDGNVMVSCIDRNHVNYIDTYYKNVPWVCFMPHGGIVTEPLPFIPYSKRLYGVSLLASIGNINTINSVIDSIKEEYGSFAEEIIKMVLSDINIPLESSIRHKLKEYDIPFDNSAFTELIFRFRAVDALRRYHKRLTLVKGLVDQEITINIWGNGWKETVLSDSKYDDLVNLHGNTIYTNINNIMHDSAIVLCDMPFFYDGSHERIFASMQSGSIIATDRSNYLSEVFCDDDNIVFYDPDNIEHLASRIKTLQNDDVKAQKIINNANAVSHQHTWQSRAESILEIAESIITV